ncbi:MAG: phosphoribosyl-AMP cyclohydrolase [Pseudomonadota bacterium]|nr:phosphoribosyl-AMP cyclohydrolase [Pseudomonadota bacterium]
MDSEKIFAARKTIEQVEEGIELAPKFDENGLIPAVTTDFESGELLMHGFMNSQALTLSIKSGEAHYFSRSRSSIWHKGETSGLVQKILELRIDDDQDCVWLRVEVSGGASCHVGYRSCFYRKLPNIEEINNNEPIQLKFTEMEKIFDPDEVYGNLENPTKL